MTDLELQLVELGREIDYPPTPTLDRDVRQRLEADRQTSPSRGRWPRRPTGRRALALAGLVLLGAAATTYAASETVRDAVRDILGISGATVERTELPPPPPGERPLELGDPVPLEDAAASLAFEPLIPRALGEPDRAFVRRSVLGGELSLIYAPAAGLPPTRSTGVGLLISEFRGDLLGDYVRKVVSDASRIVRLELGRERAVWIGGAPHFFFYSDRGVVIDRELEVAENVLLLERGNVLVRIEGALGRSEAIRIARSLSPS